jgi:hypothetical protein
MNTPGSTPITFASGIGNKNQKGKVIHNELRSRLETAGRWPQSYRDLLSEKKNKINIERQNAGHRLARFDCQW